MIWKTYTIAEEAKKRGLTKEGGQAWGPSGAGIWSAPTIDARRRVLYVATGNGYYRITLVSADRIEKCYVHNATGPSRSIVATCHMMDRVKR